jgi:chaperonin cofactor prefoldin
MGPQIDIKKIDTKIQLLKKTTEELNQLTKDFPAVARNSARILASVKMLEINVSDLMSLDA